MRRLFILFCCAPIFVFGQSMREHYAQKLTDQMNYVEAYPVWDELAKQVLSQRKGNWNVLRSTAEVARHLEKYNEAYQWFQALIRNKKAGDSDYVSTFRLALSLGKYNQMPDLLQKATAQFPQSARISEWQSNWKTIQKYLSDSASFAIKEFRPRSDAEEFSAVPYAKGVVFVSTAPQSGMGNYTYAGTGQNYTNIDFIDNPKKPDQSVSFWGNITNAAFWKEIKNTTAHDGPISFNADQTKCLLTRNQTQYTSQNGYPSSKLALYLFHKEGNHWVQDAVTWNSPDFSTGHGVMDSLGNIYFASDRPGGFGGVDLYKVDYKNGQYAEPKNLGPNINSKGNDLFPCISKNGQFYFSSDGWIGVGGLDVFTSDFNNKPEHLGLPVNSAGDDMISWYDDSSGTGYFSSNRKRQRDQIYRLTTTFKGTQLALHVTDENGNPAAGIVVTITDKVSGKSTQYTTDAQGNIAANLQSGQEYTVQYGAHESFVFAAKGKGKFNRSVAMKKRNTGYQFTMVDEQGNPLSDVMLTLYKKGIAGKKWVSNEKGWIVLPNGLEGHDAIKVSRINYEDQNGSIACNEKCNSDTPTQRIVMKQNKSDLQVNLSNILFDLNEFRLRPESKTELDKLVRYMREHPDVVIELSSHTDSRGDNNRNLLLSEFRSQICVRYIRNQGIAEDHILAKGYGETKPKNNCTDGTPCTEEEYQQNRRTELRIVVK